MAGQGNELRVPFSICKKGNHIHRRSRCSSIRIKSESDDIDTAVRRVREAFEEAVDEAEELSDQAREGSKKRSRISRHGSRRFVERSESTTIHGVSLVAPKYR
jgi:hypothetical protein